MVCLCKTFPISFFIVILKCIHNATKKGWVNVAQLKVYTQSAAWYIPTVCIVATGYAP